MGYSPQDRKESDTTERLNIHTPLSRLLNTMCARVKKAPTMKKKNTKNMGSRTHTNWKYFFFLLSVTEDTEKREHLYAVGGNVIW